MIEQNAYVVDQDQEYVWVETLNKSACGQCSARSGCGTALIDKVFAQKSQSTAVLKSFPVSIGDRVVIGLQEEALVRGSLAVYFLPLLFIFGFGLFGEMLAGQLLIDDADGLTVVASIVGLLIAAIWLRFYGRTIKFDPRYQPKLLRLTSELESR